MKKLINKIAFFGLLLTGIIGNAQNEPSLLWQIEGNGLEKPSYLFGTIHMICEDDFMMTPAIERSLENVEAFYAEIDFSNQEE
ncbi:MAG TPA: TraB/GumN family protein, partial [Flavobacterium sp.]|nr:TraB/GumN family protein [Flavobacterium sp.]